MARGIGIINIRLSVIHVSINIDPRTTLALPRVGSHWRGVGPFSVHLNIAWDSLGMNKKLKFNALGNMD